MENSKGASIIVQVNSALLIPTAAPTLAFLTAPSTATTTDPIFQPTCATVYPSSSPSFAVSASAASVRSDSSSDEGYMEMIILIWVFLGFGLVSFLFLLGRNCQQWCCNKTVNYIAAFEELQRGDNTITDNHDEVASLLSDYGVRSGEDFRELEDSDINLMASELKKVSRNKFLKHLGRKWSGDNIPFSPDVVVTSDHASITSCGVEMSTVDMHVSV